MAKVSIYLNFAGNTEEAFNFYKSVFKTEFDTPIYRMKEVPMPPGAPALPEKEQNAVMHMSLPILAGIVLQGTDMLESMGHQLKIGNNTTICLEPLLPDIRDHLIDDDPFAIQFVEGQQLVVIEVIHSDVDLCHGDRVDDLDGQDLAFERLTGILWALAMTDAVQVLGKGLEIGFAGGISEQQGAGVESAAEQVDIALVNTFKVGIIEDAGDVCGVGLMSEGCHGDEN